MEWISTKDAMPPENEIVWLYNAKDNSVWLGSHVWIDGLDEDDLSVDEENQGWVWVVNSYNSIDIYADGNKIVSEFDYIGDIEVTHWHALPELPNQITIK